jgi:hypothetical protein
MNSKQNIVLWVALALFLIAGLLPPWQSGHQAYGVSFWASSEYHVLFTCPQERFVRIDLPRLIAEWIMIIAAAGCMIYIFRNTTKN